MLTLQFMSVTQYVFRQTDAQQRERERKGYTQDNPCVLKAAVLFKLDLELSTS